ncbi:MAG: hypothetical protein V3T65_03735 [Acidobacteriota bacterium]
MKPAGRFQLLPAVRFGPPRTIILNGKTVHLVSSPASEVGMQPAGAATWKETIPPGW